MTDPLQTRANTLEQVEILFLELKLLRDTSANRPTWTRRLRALERLMKQEHANIWQINRRRELIAGCRAVALPDLFKPGDTL